MLKSNLISESIMAEIQTQVTDFLAKVIEQKPDGVCLEEEVRQLGLRCGATILQNIAKLYGQGHLGQSLPCKCDNQESSMKFIRYDRKHFVTSTGEVEFRSAYYHCKNCKSSRWPAFEKLGLGVGRLSEGARRIAAFAGADRGGFTHSKALVEKLSGIELSSSTINRVCEEIGAQMKQQQKEETQEQFEQAAKAQQGNPHKPVKLLHLAVDGTTAPTVAGYREVKTAAFYELKGRKGKKARASEVSYVSSFERAEEFGRAMWAEGASRGAVEADRIVVLADGAAWIWNLYATHFPKNRVEILDYYHASERLSEVAKAIFGEASKKASKWHKSQSKLLLKPGGAKKVLRRLKLLKSSNVAVAEIIRENVRYYENNIERMNYSEYRRKGYHIGSGLAESACKHLVGARLKQSGMTNWSEAGAEAVLRVRVAIENGRFEQYCDKAMHKRLQAAA